MSHVDVSNTTDRSPQCLGVSVRKRERKTDLHHFRVENDDDNYYSPSPTPTFDPEPEARVATTTRKKNWRLKRKRKLQRYSKDWKILKSGRFIHQSVSTNQ